MRSTVSISQLRANASKCVNRAHRNGAVAVLRRGKTVAFLVSRDRLGGILESMEILLSPEAMNEIRKYEAGKTRNKNVSSLDRD